MGWSHLYYRAYTLCLQANRYEIIPELPCMDITTLLGVIAWLSRLIES